MKLVLDALGAAGGGVSIDLTIDPPCVVARTPEGRVFAAAWPADGYVLIRLRLEAMSPSAGFEGETIEGGGLTYEAAIRTGHEGEALAAMVRHAYTFTTFTDDSSR